MSLFSIGLFLLGGAIGMLIGAVIAFGAGYAYGEKAATEAIRKRLRALQREAWKA